MGLRLSLETAPIFAMSFLSSLGSAFAGGAASSLFGGINGFLRNGLYRNSALGVLDPLGSYAEKRFGKALTAEDNYQDARSRAMMDYQAELEYQYQQLFDENQPSWKKAGLIAAGYNPMLAVNGGLATASPSVGTQSPKESLKPTPDVSALAAYQNLDVQRDLIKAQTNKTNVDTITDVVNSVSSPVVAAYGAKKGANALKAGMKAKGNPAVASKIAPAGSKSAAGLAAGLLGSIGTAGLVTLPALGVAGSAYGAGKYLESKGFNPKVNPNQLRGRMHDASPKVSNRKHN